MEKKDTKIGYIFEVDLEYPKSLWEEHNDYPLAPEKLKINKVEKLVSTFLPKTNYVLHYKNLKQYLEEGMILKKSTSRHKILSITLDGALYQKTYRIKKKS